MERSIPKWQILAAALVVLMLALFALYRAGIGHNGGAEGQQSSAGSAPLASATSPSTSPVQSASETNPPNLELGVYLPGVPADISAITSHAAAVGAMPAVVMWYQVWGSTGDQPFPTESMDTITKLNVVPMITWEPHAGDMKDPNYSLATIVTGKHDDYIKVFAAAAANWGKPFYLRFAPEMNGDWVAWGQGINGNTPEQFVQAWRHVHDLFAQAGATNVRWVWSPNIETYYRSFTDLYPGDAYVDWVGLDGYNASAVWQSPWLSMAQIFGQSYDELVTMTDKPIMIAETASTEVGGDKAAWITNAYLRDIPARLPRVRLVVWFSEQNRDTDWRIDSSQASLDAYRHVVAVLPNHGGLVRP